MSDLAQAANDIRFLAARFKGFLAAAEALEKVGSIEDAATAAQNRLRDLLTQEDQVKQRAALIIKEAGESADKIKAAAESHHEAVRRSAKMAVDQQLQEAESLIGDAEREAKAHRDIAEGHRITVHDLEQTIAAKTAEHDELLEQMTSIRVEYERVQKLIDELKAKLA